MAKIRLDGLEKGPDARSVPSVRVPKAAELVAGHIRRQIVRGELKPGEPLQSEADLMVEFGVSRPTLREAFRILEVESLIFVTRGARGGARVHAPDIRVAARYAGLLLQYAGTTVEDVQSARSVIEPPIVARLAESCSAQDIRTLRDHLQQEKQAKDDGAAFAELDTRFHALLAELSGSQTLTLVVGMLHGIIESHSEFGLAQRQDTRSAARVVRSHGKLVDLIEAQDAEGAEAHWYKHISNVTRALLKTVGRKTVVDLFD